MFVLDQNKRMSATVVRLVNGGVSLVLTSRDHRLPVVSHWGTVLAPDDDLTDVLLHEKQREDWIRGTTQRRYGRWGTAHLALGALRTRLASFHIHPPR